jgi:hypothetical protein
VGKEALSTGSRILDDVVDGQSIKESASKEALKGVDNLLEKGGLGRQYGTGKKQKKRERAIPYQKNFVGKSVNFKFPPSSTIKNNISKQNNNNNNIKSRRKRSDAFGFY